MKMFKPISRTKRNITEIIETIFNYRKAVEPQTVPDSWADKKNSSPRCIWYPFNQKNIPKMNVLYSQVYCSFSVWYLINKSDPFCKSADPLFWQSPR